MLRNELSELSVIIIDELSMVSNKLLLFIHQRLVEIFGCPPDNPFAGISIIACGDFYQLSPIQQKPIYADFNDAMLNISHPWRYFKIAELTEVMRQRGNQTLINLLNNIRIGVVTENDEAIIKSRLISRDDPSYPIDAINIWAENLPVNEHNNFMLNRLPGCEYELISIDKVPNTVTETMLEKVNRRSQMNTGGSARKLVLKMDAKVMLTSNVDVADKLNNGQIGVIKHLRYDMQGNITTIYLKMEDETAGIKTMNSDSCSNMETHSNVQDMLFNLTLNIIHN